jgi:hypothetical protein
MFWRLEASGIFCCVFERIVSCDMRNNQENLKLDQYRSDKPTPRRKPSFVSKNLFSQLKYCSRFMAPPFHCFPQQCPCVLQFLKPAKRCFHFLIHLLFVSRLHDSCRQMIWNYKREKISCILAFGSKVTRSAYTAGLKLFFKICCPYKITVQFWGKYLTLSVILNNCYDSCFIPRTRYRSPKCM